MLVKKLFLFKNKNIECKNKINNRKLVNIIKEASLTILILD